MKVNKPPLSVIVYTNILLYFQVCVCVCVCNQIKCWLRTMKLLPLQKPPSLNYFIAVVVTVVTVVVVVMLFYCDILLVTAVSLMVMVRLLNYT